MGREREKHQLSGMTVRELIETLQELPDQDKQVVFAFNYGDRQKTLVVEGVTEIDETRVVWSDYHRSFKLADAVYDEDENEQGDENVVVLK